MTLVRRFLAFAFCLLPVQSLKAGSTKDSCPAQPNSLLSMRDCYRPLLVFTPSLNDPESVRQLDELSRHSPEMKDRDIVVILITSRDAVAPRPPADLPAVALSQSEVAAARSRFKVGSHSFRVILIGKDGSQKLSSGVVVSVDKLSSLVDSMPMRKQEIKQRSQVPEPH